MTFVEALLRRGVNHRIGRDGRIHLSCPFCGDPRLLLCVHPHDGWGRCMNGRCNWKHRWAIAPVLKQLGVVATVTEAGATPVPQKFDPITLPEDFQLLTHVYDDLDLQAQKYVLNRGVTEAQIRSCRIGISYVGRYAYRVLFPIYVGRELKAVNARTFVGAEPRYLNSRGDKFLFHFDPKQEVTVLSEGVIKALRIKQTTSFGSASLLGHDLADTQAQQITESSCRHAIIFPDPDIPGVKGAANVAEKLISVGLKVSMVWPVSLPADDIPLEELRSILSTNVVPYSWTVRQQMLLRFC